MPRHSDNDDVPVSFSPFGFNFSKIPFLPMVADQALAGFRIAINTFFYTATCQLLVRLVAEHLYKSRVHLQEPPVQRSEEHTSELQLPDHLVCRLQLDNK